MPPVYEKEQDRVNEQRVAEVILGVAKGVDRAKKLSFTYHVDYALCNGDTIMAWLEVKCRDVPFGAYPDIILSLHKWHHGLMLEEWSKAPFYVAFRFNDGIYLARASKCEGISYRCAGRTDRGNEKDHEPCVAIPLSNFKSVNSLKKGT